MFFEHNNDTSSPDSMLSHHRAFPPILSAAPLLRSKGYPGQLSYERRLFETVARNRRSESVLISSIEGPRVCPYEGRLRRQQQQQRLTEGSRDLQGIVRVYKNTETTVENLENSRTGELLVGKKRGRVASWSDESPERDTSRSLSPEISYGGSPATYKLCALRGEYLVVKVPMNESRDGRKKCSDRDIARILDSDGECDLIFEGTKKCDVPAVASQPGDVLPTIRTPEQATKRPLRRRGHASSERASSESPRDAQGSLRLKLRRSTEQSNYKIQEIGDERKCRSSTRSNIGTPKKCSFADCSADHGAREKTRCGVETPTTRRGSRTPKGGKRGTRLSDDYERAETSSGGNTASLKKRIQDVAAGTPRSTRSRRTIGRVDYDRDDFGVDTVNKENKSDNDIDDASDGAASRGRERSSESGHMRMESPKRGRTKGLEEAAAPLTPKRTPRKLGTRRIEKEEAVTPISSRKRISKAETPSMTRRTANIGKPTTVLEEARANLHVSAVPKSLPCRETEFNDIYQFLERKLLDENSGCIYISGVPGTGKTATVNEVVRCLKKLVDKGDLENFNYVEINGMKLSEPRQAYVQILKQMHGWTGTWEQAYSLLDNRFARTTSKRLMTLLLVDELDLLCNKRQDVVYNLLDWPAKPNARLIVVTIANTMDLPERALMGRVTSRLGLTRLTFQPYTHKQLQEIVVARLKHSDAFRSEAIELVARKVAAVSGDARRALDICRRATEIAELNDARCVTMGDVNEALSEMIASSKVQAIQHCSMMEKLFVQAVGVEVVRTGVEETLFQDVYRQLGAMCSFEGLTVPNVSEALAICARLGANRLLLCEHSRIDTLQRILLNISLDDLHFATQKFDSD